MTDREEGMNGLFSTTASHRCLGPIPAAVPCAIVLLLLAGLTISLLILIIVHNALLLTTVLLSTVSTSFLLWNAASFRNHGALLVFPDRLPTSDPVTTKDGQLIKIPGII